MDDLTVDLSVEQGFTMLRRQGLRYIFCDYEGCYWASNAKPLRRGSSWERNISWMNRSLLIVNCPFHLRKEDRAFDLATEYIWKESDFFLTI